MIGRLSILLSSDYKRYVCGPRFSWKMYGPIDRDWNFTCLLLTSWCLSHFKTKSPTSKLVFPIDLLSNHLLILFWWSVNFFLLSSFLPATCEVYPSYAKQADKACLGILGTIGAQASRCLAEGWILFHKPGSMAKCSERVWVLHS